MSSYGNPGSAPLLRKVSGWFRKFSYCAIKVSGVTKLSERCQIATEKNTIVFGRCPMVSERCQMVSGMCKEDVLREQEGFRDRWCQEGVKKVT